MVGEQKELLLLKHIEQIHVFLHLLFLHALALSFPATKLDNRCHLHTDTEHSICKPVREQMRQVIALSGWRMTYSNVRTNELLQLSNAKGTLTLLHLWYPHTYETCSPTIKERRTHLEKLLFHQTIVSSFHYFWPRHKDSFLQVLSWYHCFWRPNKFDTLFGLATYRLFGLEHC